MPDTAPTIEPSPRPKGRRIAQKLFLSYALPLAVLIVAGLLLPVFLWSYLGQPLIEYQAREAFWEQTDNLQRAAVTSEGQVRSYLLLGDASYVAEYEKARDSIRTLTTELFREAETLDNPLLHQRLDNAVNSYREWVRLYVLPELRTPRVWKPGGAGGSSNEVRSSRMRVAFVSVRANLDLLNDAARKYADDQAKRSQFADMLRRVTSVAIPAAALLLSALISRSIALSITRPLERLTEATEALERGDANPLVVADNIGHQYSDDEIGELQWGFQQMARTIGQREAVLRAQYEALSSLNRRVEAVLNATNDGIVLLDRAGAFSVVNLRFSEFFGLEPDVLIDQPYQQAAPLLLSRFKHRATVRKRLEEIVNDPSAIVEETFEIAEPVVRVLRVYSAPVLGEESGSEMADKRLGRIFVFRDVTREVNVDRMKTEFVATVSHELRTPLTAIKGYVDLMLGGKTGPLSAVQTEFLHMTQESTERLTTLINDMLDVSRIESGKMEIRQESVDYIPLVEQTLRLMQRQAEEKRVTLNLEILGDATVPPVRGDADRITQILVNFISNGIKYTGAGGTVRVLIEQEADFITTCVADSGIGIAPEDQPKLFQKFFRADNSTTRAAGGTGLGLAITKAILDKLGGSVWVESTPGTGSRFWFTLPIATEPLTGDTVPLEPVTPARAPETDGQPFILSIDSDPASLHRLGHTLRQQGYVTSNATTPAEAFRRARGLRPDLITLDLLTPGFDAFALLRALRENAATKNLPVALAALHTSGARVEVSDGPVFLPRDGAPESLASAVRNALAARLMHEDGSTASRNARPVALVVGDGELAEAVRNALSGTNVHVVATASPEEADSRVSGLFPDVVVLDTTAAPGNAAGTWVARLRDRRPGVRLPVVVLTDADTLAGNTFPLLTPGTGPVKLERIGARIADILHKTP